MKRVPMILQMEAVECGAACLAMVLGYYGRHVPLGEMRIECAVTRDGTKASNILICARKFGLTAKGYRKEPAALAQLPFPQILFWNFNHFVVLESIARDHYRINDPASGRRLVDRLEFDQAFTGVVLTFEPTPAFTPGGAEPSVLPALRRRAALLTEPLGFMAATGLLALVPGLALSAFAAVFVDAILVSHRLDWLWPFVAAFVGTSIAAAGLSLLEQYHLARFMTKFSLVGGTGFLWHLLRLPAAFFAQRSSGDLSGRVMLNHELGATLSTRLYGALVDAATAVVFGFVLFWIDWTIGLAVSLLLALELSLLRRQAARIAEAGEKVAIDSGKLHGFSLTGLSLIESLKASGAESEFFGRWAGYQARFLISTQEAARRTLLVSLLPELSQTLHGLVLLGLGSLRVMEGHLTLGTLVAMQVLALRFVGPVSRLANLAGTLQQVRGSLNRLDDVLLNPPDPLLPAASPTPPAAPAVLLRGKLRGHLQLRNVTFGYNLTEAPLLKDFSLDAEPGRRIAIVGPSGCGKSTVSRLIMGLYAPWSGEILLDGVPRNSIDRVTLAASLAMVDQDISLFRTTIRDNVRLWDESIPDQDVLRAARDAQIHADVMRRPGGYDLCLTERGYDLSGGQRQRLEIARALARNPRILVLDEATSALDAVTEQAIDEHIRRRGCTCIVIAHRLSTIRDADEIIVLQNGADVERGTHSSLLAADGLYRQLVTA
jgi:NHLM bacteriocin system ABC transporter peptidase/ATP-binding protein